MMTTEVLDAVKDSVRSRVLQNLDIEMTDDGIVIAYDGNNIHTIDAVDAWAIISSMG